MGGSTLGVQMSMDS